MVLLVVVVVYIDELTLAPFSGESDGEAECAQASAVPQNIVGSLATWRAAAPAEAPQR